MFKSSFKDAGKEAPSLCYVLVKAVVGGAAVAWPLFLPRIFVLFFAF